jgi:hypothetical protein
MSKVSVKVFLWNWHVLDTVHFLNFLLNHTELMSTFLHAIAEMFTQFANKMGLQKEIKSCKGNAVCVTCSQYHKINNLNYWVMHPVARVSINIYRNLRTQQMSVLVLLCTSYTTTIENIIKFYIFMSNLHINILKQQIRWHAVTAF